MHIKSHIRAGVINFYCLAAQQEQPIIIYIYIHFLLPNFILFTLLCLQGLVFMLFKKSYVGTSRAL